MRILTSACPCVSVPHGQGNGTASCWWPVVEGAARAREWGTRGPIPSMKYRCCESLWLCGFRELPSSSQWQPPGCATAGGPSRFGQQKAGHGGQLAERGHGLGGFVCSHVIDFGLWSGWLTHCTIPALLNDLMDEMIVFFFFLDADFLIALEISSVCEGKAVVLWIFLIQHSPVTFTSGQERIPWHTVLSFFHFPKQ